MNKNYLVWFTIYFSAIFSCANVKVTNMNKPKNVLIMYLRMKHYIL